MREPARVGFREGQGRVNDLVVELIPLIVGSAVVPVHIVITILLVLGPSGRTAALGWVAGMTTVRLLQGLVFGVLFEAGEAASGAEDESGAGVAVLLLVLAVLFYVVAAKQLLQGTDEDAPPPRWMTMLDGVTPARAFALGAGFLAVSAKFWVFTLGAIAAIEAAELSGAMVIAAFLAFVVLAQVVHFGVLAFAYAAPARAETALGRFSTLLTRYNGPIVIVLGLVFGTWFLLKALAGLGIV